LAKWTTNEIATARAAAAALLEALELPAYLFEVEPGDQRWHVKVEWARGQEWTTVTLSTDNDKLLRSHDDSRVRDDLLEEWRQALGDERAGG
jgi:hypothetical protein